MWAAHEVRKCQTCFPVRSRAVVAAGHNGAAAQTALEPNISKLALKTLASAVTSLVQDTLFMTGEWLRESRTRRLVHRVVPAHCGHGCAQPLPADAGLKPRVLPLCRANVTVWA
jgi:hypothetical protein